MITIKGLSAARNADRKESFAQNDDELVVQALGGDKDAYRVLVERYQTRVYAIAYEIVKSKEDAEDIAQEAFVKAYLSLSTFKGESSFFTWLYRIVHNMALDVRRKLMRRGGAPQEYKEVTTLQSNDTTSAEGLFSGSTIPSPQEAILEREKAAVLQRALQEISEEHRAIMVLREIDGLSYDEIASATGISKGTVMSRLFYARKRLQKALVDSGFAPGIPHTDWERQSDGFQDGRQV